MTDLPAFARRIELRMSDYELASRLVGPVNENVAKAQKNLWLAMIVIAEGQHRPWAIDMDAFRKK